MGGSRANSNNILLDGIPNMNAVSQVAFIPSPDSVQEMKVQINTYDAEFGRGAGGVLNATIKSGTNRFHASLHEFFRNDKLEANNYINNSVGERKARQRFNLFGGTAGGPVYLPRIYDGRNRTFVFGSWESIRQSDPTTSLTTVPHRRNGTRLFEHLRRLEPAPADLRPVFTAGKPEPRRWIPARPVSRELNPATAWTRSPSSSSINMGLPNKPGVGFPAWTTSSGRTARRTTTTRS
jgi:hypothetical protein